MIILVIIIIQIKLDFVLKWIADCTLSLMLYFLSMMFHCCSSCTCGMLMRVKGCPCMEARAGEMGFTKIMPCGGSPEWGDGSVPVCSGVEFGVLEPGIRPRFCKVKLRMAGLGLWMRCPWEVKGETDGIRWRGSRVGVTSWGSLEPGKNRYISDCSIHYVHVYCISSLTHE